MMHLPLAWLLLSSVASSHGGAVVEHLDSTRDNWGPLAAAFAEANPGHSIDWQPGLERFTASGPCVAFVQSGEGSVELPGGTSGYSVGDLFCLDAGQTVALSPPAGLLIFSVPQALTHEPPPIIRPDWDDQITDTPGGCATEGDAYRRVCLTWQSRNGPYRSHQVNAHRVRIHDSFTHYHPIEGGFDEFYLVQEAPAGAKLLVSDQLDAILSPGSVTREQAANLLQEFPLRTGDFIYLPRGVVHRGLGGAVVQVIAVPGFVPGAEIAVDAQLESINQRLGLEGDEALPFHQGADHVAIEAGEGGHAIRIGGRPFAVVSNDRRLPDIRPLRSPTGQAVTRAWPGEGKLDHPHHQSVWLAHGDVNGIDFWHDPDASIRQVGEVQSSSEHERGSLEATFAWIGPGGEEVLREQRRIEAFRAGDAFGLDVDCTLEAVNGAVRFGDTKEGSFALRLADGLVADGPGELRSSEGRTGKDAWGRPARWIEARGVVNGKPAAVVLAGHHDNLRHPTPWHARTYGLLAANPFGLVAFGGDALQSGEVVLSAGESLRLRYRVLVFAGHPGDEEIEAQLAGFSSPPGG